MAGKTVQRRRGTTAEHATFTGANGELTVDTTKKVVVVHDGATAGGFPMAKAGPLGSSGITGIDGAIQSQLYTAFTTGGTSTAFTLTPVPAITAYAAGQSFSITTHITSGASPTLNISGLGATLNIVRRLQDGTYQNVSSLPAGVYRATLVSTTQALFENVQPLIVGTVSQSAGVPTGAIIERGSNANGSYVRYADGTQICWANLAAVSRAMTSAFGSMFALAAPVTRTFPVAFASAPTVSGTIFSLGGSTRVVVSVTTTTTTTYSFDLLSLVTMTTNVGDGYIAIGTWY